VFPIHHPLRLDFQVVLEVEEEVLRGHLACIKCEKEEKEERVKIRE
jgi:hypothetical protein